MATFYLPSSTGYYSTENTYAVWRINVTEDYSSTNGKRLKCELIAWKLSGATEGSSASGYVQWYLDGVASTKTTWGSGGRNIPASGTVTIDTVYITLSDSATSAKITAEFSMNNSVGTNTNGGTVSLSTYTLTFNANGGSWSHGNLTGCYRNTLNIKNAWPTRTGYTFKGWGTTSTATSPSYYGGSKYVITGNATLYAIWEANTYTITYDANGGSSAPAAQSYTYASTGTVTLSSIIPTRTGYTFLGWSTSSTSTSATYSSGGTFSKNVASNTTLYAVWSENKLTVNYYSNYATSAFSDALNTVGSSVNVLVYTQSFYYDNDYSTYGHPNYSVSSGSVYMTRTGYAGTGNWGTSINGGILINEDTGYSTGQALAEALGKDLSSGNASVNLYAQWTENKLTINYYSNYADYGTLEGTSLNLSSSKNVLVYTQVVYYDNAYNNGLSDVQNASYLYLSRTGYNATGYWGTTTSGGTKVHQSTSFPTGQALAQALGKDISIGDASVNVYAQWSQNEYTLTLNPNGGTVSQTVFTLVYNTTTYYGINAYLPTRSGYKFLGWYTSATGGTQVYDETGICINDGVYWKENKYIYPSNLTLYAHWEALNVAWYKTDNVYKLCRTYVKINDTWQPAIMYKKIDETYKRSIV